MTNIIATAGDISTAGLIVWWTLHGDTLVEELEESLQAESLEDYTVPRGPNPDTSVLRALNDQRTTTRTAHRTLHRPLEGGHGRALVREEAHEDDLDYEVQATAKHLAGRIVVSCDDADLKQRIEDAYYDHLFARLNTHDVSVWLSHQVVPRLDGLSLRDGGGFYFIPHEHVAAWKRVVTALKEVSGHSFYSVSALHADNAVEAILASVKAEAAALATDSWGKIALGEVQGGALDSAAKRAADMHEKVERYEKLLGVSLDEMQDSLKTLRASLAAAALKARNGDDYTGLSAGAGDMSWLEEEQ